jgi:hypothetical protein
VAWESPCERRGGAWGPVSRVAIPLAVRMSAGRSLLVTSAAIAIAAAAAVVVASGGTTSSTKRSRKALVTLMASAFIARNQPTGTRRPSMATRRGALSQASSLSATRVTVPSEASRPAMRSGSSASGSLERGHQPPSRVPWRASVGSQGAAAAPAARTALGEERRWCGRCCVASSHSAPSSVPLGNRSVATTGQLAAAVILAAGRSSPGVDGVGLRSGGSRRFRPGAGVRQRDGWVWCAGGQARPGG